MQRIDEMSLSLRVKQLRRASFSDPSLPASPPPASHNHSGSRGLAQQRDVGDFRKHCLALLGPGKHHRHARHTTYHAAGIIFFCWLCYETDRTRTEESPRNRFFLKCVHHESNLLMTGHANDCSRQHLSPSKCLHLQFGDQFQSHVN